MNKLKLIFILLIVAVILPIGTSKAADSTIVWQVLSGGGTNSSNSTYVLKGTLRQTAIRHGTNSSNINRSGFWPYAFSLGPCCTGIRGNCDGDPEDKVNILDHTFLKNRIFNGGPPPSCFEEGDVNGDGSSANIVDLSYMTDYLFRGGPPPPSCP